MCRWLQRWRWHWDWTPWSVTEGNGHASLWPVLLGVGRKWRRPLLWWSCARTCGAASRLTPSTSGSVAVHCCINMQGSLLVLKICNKYNNKDLSHLRYMHARWELPWVTQFLLLFLWSIFQVLINSFVCCFSMSALGLILFQIFCSLLCCLCCCCWWWCLLFFFFFLFFFLVGCWQLSCLRNICSFWSRVPNNIRAWILERVWF